MNKGKLRCLLKEVSHLTKVKCHNEALIKVAVAVNRFDIMRLIMAIDSIQDIEKTMPRTIAVYRGAITERLLSHIGEHFNEQIKLKILDALTIKDTKGNT